MFVNIGILLHDPIILTVVKAPNAAHSQLHKHLRELACYAIKRGVEPPRSCVEISSRS